MKKSELTAFIKEEILSTLTTEGVWSKGDDTAIRDFILDVEQLKDDYYDIVGSDDVFNGLDLAIKAANDLIAMDLNESTEEEIAKTKELTKAMADLAKAKEEAGLAEEEEKEPSKADLKKTKGLAKAKEELAQLTKQMKSLARDYKEAEGEEKEKIVADLKKKTKLKKELEAIIDK